HNVILSIGGIPLIYLGDEVGTLNDYSYRQNPAKADDSRWVHRPEADPELYALSTDESTIPGKIFHGLQNLIELRKSTPIIQQGLPEFIDSGNPHVFAYRHAGKEANILFLNNFSDQPQTVPNNVLRLCNLVFPLVDMVSGTVIKDETVLSLAPCQYLWLQSES
ncbi:MAG: DUF3459 domain-containing protein, partial [Porticoccaceae bacterium]|nr:DUF3459 domain-containing protein [Porticoccaceae bacterium]